MGPETGSDKRDVFLPAGQNVGEGRNPPCFGTHGRTP
jgi:hypothetical protein